MALIIPGQTGESKNISANIQAGYVYLMGGIAALGGVLFGFDLVIISGTVNFFTTHFQLNEFQTGLAVGCINLGSALGAMVAGKLSDWMGRKKMLMICAALFIVTGIGTGWAPSYETFIAFRICSGVAVGIAALVCPMYVAEISPASVRGKMVSLYQLSIVIGIMLAYLSNYWLLHSGVNNWRWMFSSQVVPAFIFLVGLFAVAESPRWLIRKKRNSEALLILQKIGGETYAAQSSREIAASFLNEQKEDWKDIFQVNIRHIILIGIVVAVCSQAVGQNSIFSYAPELFKQAGLAQDSAFLQSVLLGVVNLVFTFVAIFTIEKAGRRKLLLIGAALLCVDAILLAAAFFFSLSGIYMLVCMLVFIAIYSATLGPVTWVALSELFPNRIRGMALSVATLSLWIANFFTTASFPVMKAHLGLPATFLIHGGVAMLCFFYVLKKMPETKGKTLEQIEAELTT